MTLTKSEIINIIKKVAEDMTFDVSEKLERDIYTLTETIGIDMIDYSDMDAYVEADVVFGYNKGFEYVEVKDVMNVKVMDNDLNPIQVAA